jgi:hypothetical protein
MLPEQSTRKQILRRSVKLSKNSVLCDGRKPLSNEGCSVGTGGLDKLPELPVGSFTVAAILPAAKKSAGCFGGFDKLTAGRFVFKGIFTFGFGSTSGGGVRAALRTMLVVGTGRGGDRPLDRENCTKVKAPKTAVCTAMVVIHAQNAMLPRRVPETILWFFNKGKKHSVIFFRPFYSTISTCE